MAGSKRSTRTGLANGECTTPEQAITLATRAETASGATCLPRISISMTACPDAGIESVERQLRRLAFMRITGLNLQQGGGDEAETAGQQITG